MKITGFCSSLLMGCAAVCSKARPLSASDVLGSHGTEVVELKKDGAFFQRYNPASGAASVTNEGKWVFDAETQSIAFADLYMFDGGKGRIESPLTKSRWILQMVRDGSKIAIALDPDHAALLEKQ